MSFASTTARAVDGLAIATFTAMFACVLAQVVFRYFFGDPLVWSDELARYLFIWCSFLGWVIAARKRSHLSVSIMADRLASSGRALATLLGAVAAIAFAALLVYYGVRITARNWDVETTSLAMPMGVVYAIVPVAAAAVAFHAFADARSALRMLLGSQRTPR
jgi:TRAP-type C4-dicarboxylate transport system permease small subunit